MRIITEQERAFLAPSVYKAKYQDGRYPDNAEKIPVLEALTVGSITPKIIAEIIGNNTWTLIVCFECKREAVRAVIFSNELCLCCTCVDKAFDLVNKSE